MTIDAARRSLVLGSLILTGIFFVFFLIAPIANYPLTTQQALRLLEIVIPVLGGYLGSASRFVIGQGEPVSNVRSEELLGLIVTGALVVFSFAIAAALTAFGWSNRAAAPPGSGMSVDNLALVFSLALAFLALTTGILVDGVFGRQAARETKADSHK